MFLSCFFPKRNRTTDLCQGQNVWGHVLWDFKPKPSSISDRIEDETWLGLSAGQLARRQCLGNEIVALLETKSWRGLTSLKTWILQKICGEIEKSHVAQRQPQNINALEEICKEKWAAIPDMSANLVKSYHKYLTRQWQQRFYYKVLSFVFDQILVNPP